MDCPNLKRLYGDRFRVTYEESYTAERGEGARGADPWLQIIPCKYGHLFPWGRNLLAASVDGHSNIAGELRRLACCLVVQDGDRGELTATFDPGDFEQVAEVMQPRKRRQVNLSDEQRAEIGRRLNGARNAAPQATLQMQPTAQGRPRRDALV